MNIQQSVINKEINAILSSGTKPVFYDWEVHIHANNKTIKPMIVLAIDMDRDYIKQLSDVLSVEVSLPQGDVDIDIIPYKSKLEVTLIRKPLKETTTAQTNDYLPPVSFRYKAVLYDGSSNEVKGNLPNVKDKETANRTSLVDIRLQLLNPVLEVLRTMTFGGSLRNVSPAIAIRSIFSTRKHLTAGLDNNQNSIKGVNIAYGANDKVRKHIIIPHLTPLLKIPDLIHREAGGVFASGLGFYLQGNYWYMFAPYDLKAYSRSNKTLTIITVPANRVVKPERSYRETPNQVLLLATGESKHIELSESQQLNKGNGIIFMDATKAFEEWGVVENNKFIVDKSKNVTQATIAKREDGIDFLRQTDTKFTSNPLFEYSKLASRFGDVIQHTWENANPDLLYPGMPVRNMYISNNQAKELYGVLIGVKVLNTSDTKGMVNRIFTNKCVLTVFVEKDLQTE